MKPSRLSALPSGFGLIGWLEDTRVALPLKGVECRFDVTGAIACVELDQIYHQNAGRPLDCTYTFPLPAGAAVHRCEVHINGRVIRARVEARDEARRIFREQKAAGRRAALVETERENLFTLSLGNVQPDDVIVVRFAWFQVLDRAGDGMRLLVPTCPGIRYIPGTPLLRGPSGRGTVDDTDQVPDASRITPPRIEALHPDAAYFSLEGRMSASDVESGTASSPSHSICVREREGAVTVELTGRGAVPDRDFVLAWREPKVSQLAPQVWHWTEGNEAYALVQLRAPEAVKVAEAFPQDFYFLVDRSGSMEGAKWRRTCEALQAFVGLLGAEDRVWITLFESGYRDFAEAPMTAAGVLADRGFQRMESLGTGGGTELLPAARHVLEQIARHSVGRRTTVVLITDGEMGNDQEIARTFKQAPLVTVHTFGIDTAVNDAFLKSLARQQRGGCWLQTPDDDITGTIAALGDRLRRPVLTDLSVRGSWEAGRGTWPDLHAREVVTVALRGEARSPVEITGRFPDGSEHQFVVELAAMGSEAIKLLWAKERIAALIASDRQPEAIALARQHTLICEGAAFIAWDEAEQVPIAKEEIVQPALGESDVLYSAVSAPCTPLYEAGSRFMRDAAKPSSSGFFAPRARATDLRRPVAEVCQALELVGVPRPTAVAWVAWAQGNDREAATRLASLRAAAELVAEMRSEMGTPILRDRIESCLRHMLSGSPEALLQWAEETRRGFAKLMKLRLKLSDAGSPAEVVDHLFVWVVDSGRFDRGRLDQLNRFADSLDHLPFSAGSAAGRWRAFLDSTVGRGSSASAVVSQWLQETSVAERETALRPGV